VVVDSMRGYSASESKLVAAWPAAKRTAWLLRHFGLNPRKSLGQNFLVDDHHIARLVEATLAGAPRQVVEIGGGLGALTVPLAQAGVALTVYEVDRRLAQVLQWLTEGMENVRVVAADVLQVKLEGGREVVAVGNLPYYVTTPILEHLFNASPPFGALVVTVQQEVGERIRARPGTKAYGPLTLWCRFYAASIEVIGRLPATVFRPRPKVDSLALRMVLRRKPPAEVADAASFFAAVQGALGHRRKTLLNSLRADARLQLPAGREAEVVKRAGLDGKRRGETLDFEEFVRLGNALAAERSVAADGGHGNGT